LAARVIVYTAPVCPFCVHAKRLLHARGIPFDEIDVADAPERRAEMMRRSGRRTVPQIFIDGAPVGGYQELLALDRRGELGGLGKGGG
jgi:glutaredoxin 3